MYLLVRKYCLQFFVIASLEANKRLSMNNPLLNDQQTSWIFNFDTVLNLFTDWNSNALKWKQIALDFDEYPIKTQNMLWVGKNHKVLMKVRNVYPKYLYFNCQCTCKKNCFNSHL